LIFESKIRGHQNAPDAILGWQFASWSRGSAERSTPKWRTRGARGSGLELGRACTQTAVLILRFHRWNSIAECRVFCKSRHRPALSGSLGIWSLFSL